MFTRTMLKSKIHRATVTDANLNYEGSITIDPLLMELAGIFEYEQVHVWNITNGSRFVTYAIKGEPEKGTICVNGAAAHLTGKDDIVIIATFSDVEDELKQICWRPAVIHVDEANRPVDRSVSAGPLGRAF